MCIRDRLSDGDPEVHAQLKDIVKAQVDAIVENLRASGQVDVIEAKELVCLSLIHIEMCIRDRDSISDGMYEKYFREEERRYPAVGGTFWTTCTAHILKGMEETDYEPLKKARHCLLYTSRCV